MDAERSRRHQPTIEPRLCNNAFPVQETGRRRACKPPCLFDRRHGITPKLRAAFLRRRSWIETAPPLQCHLVNVEFLLVNVEFLPALGCFCKLSSTSQQPSL